MMRGLTALLPLAVLLAGCASSPQSAASPTPSPTGSGQILSAYRELARCLRSHATPGFPDPVLDPRTGEVTLPPGTREPTEAAMNACRSIADRLPAKGGGRASPATTRRSATRRPGASCTAAAPSPSCRCRSTPPWRRPCAAATR
ncbi:hypothetical protein [Sphaerisporangium siamense]|uniref:Lipoprotein n=1 Tax=Sphaerisporangium siamense TaxID=795645 RepID=A0A7W7GA87_9ACTN|nr:hypothetical protein [Sphaerisporangium siamense]MBB4702172.1 hypothetical protein [Sphaerisporangium siamense]